MKGKKVEREWCSDREGVCPRKTLVLINLKAERNVLLSNYPSRTE